MSLPTLELAQSRWTLQYQTVQAKPPERQIISTNFPLRRSQCALESHSCKSEILDHCRGSRVGKSFFFEFCGRSPHWLAREPLNDAAVGLGGGSEAVLEQTGTSRPLPKSGDVGED